MLLYSYWNQKRHLEELSAAFGQLFDRSRPKNMIVIDLGCGPFTGGTGDCGDNLGQTRELGLHRRGSLTGHAGDWRTTRARGGGSGTRHPAYAATGLQNYVTSGGAQHRDGAPVDGHRILPAGEPEPRRFRA